MLLDLWFHHHQRNEQGAPYWVGKRRPDPRKENDEAALMLGLM